MGRFVDLTGQHFGRLTVIERAGSWRSLSNPLHSAPAWRCLCDPTLGGCGRETVVTSSNLRSGKIRSCGCLRNEAATINLYEARKCRKKEK